jgi:hypothetical protein
VAAGWDKLGTPLGVIAGARLGFGGGSCAHNMVLFRGDASARDISRGSRRAPTSFKIRVPLFALI